MTTGDTTTNLCEKCGKNPGILYKGKYEIGRRRYALHGVSVVKNKEYAHTFCTPCIEDEMKKNAMRSGIWVTTAGVILVIVALMMDISCVCPGAAILVVLFGLSQFIQYFKPGQFMIGKEVAYRSAGAKMGLKLENRERRRLHDSELPPELRP